MWQTVSICNLCLTYNQATSIIYISTDILRRSEMKRFLKFFKVATLVLFAIAVAYTLVIGFFADANVSKMNIANYIVYGAMLTGSAFFIVAYSKKSYLSIHAQTSKDATFKNIRPIWRLLGYMVLWMGACAICVWLATTADWYMTRTVPSCVMWASRPSWL